LLPAPFCMCRRSCSGNYLAGDRAVLLTAVLCHAGFQLPAHRASAVGHPNYGYAVTFLLSLRDVGGHAQAGRLWFSGVRRCPRWQCGHHGLGCRWLGLFPSGGMGAVTGRASGTVRLRRTLFLWEWLAVHFRQPDILLTDFWAGNGGRVSVCTRSYGVVTLLVWASLIFPRRRWRR